MMRRIVLLLASMALAVLLASGAALGVTRSEQPSGRSFEPQWIDEPMPTQGESFESALFGGHWTSVTPEEGLRYHNPEKVYPRSVAHGARAWNALDARFNGRGVRLIEVDGDAEPTVLIDGIRDCKDRSWLGFAQYRQDRPNRIIPDRLGVNTCALDKEGRKLRAHVLTHELGHHLGSGHQRQRFCGKSIMLKSVPCGRKRIVLTKPGGRDVKWYRNRWAD